MKLFIAIAGTTLLGLLSFTFPSVRNLSYRKGAGWYLDVSQRPYPEASPEAESRLPRYQLPTRPAVVPAFALRTWLMAGAGSLILAALLWSDLPVIAIIVGILGLLLLGMTAEAKRQNRAAATEPTRRPWSPKHPRRPT
jgi:hypothetical protein